MKGFAFAEVAGRSLKDVLAVWFRCALASNIKVSFVTFCALIGSMLLLGMSVVDAPFVLGKIAEAGALKDIPCCFRKVRMAGGCGR